MLDCHILLLLWQRVDYQSAVFARQSLLQANAHVFSWTGACARKSLTVVCGLLFLWGLHLVRVIHTSTTGDHCFRNLSFKLV